jgi:hypothetical protein
MISLCTVSCQYSLIIDTEDTYLDLLLPYFLWFSSFPVYTMPNDVFARSNAGIVCSNPTQGMYACVYSVFVLGSGLATGCSLVQGVLPNVLG